MGKISFSVSARTAKLIGQENFATAEGAIIELVKNCYDADATSCMIIFDNSTSEQTKLYIIDNGIGMTEEVIINQWMKIGTDDKLSNYESGNGRIKTGAKGIGRFALDRLGLSSEMLTVAKENKRGCFWSVQWSDFDVTGIAIEDVNAQLDVREDIDLKKQVLELFKDIEQISEQVKDLDLASGTILTMYSLKDRWDEEAVKSLFDNLEVLIPPQEQPDFTLHLFLTSMPEEFGKINSAYYDDFDYKVSAIYVPEDKNKLEVSIARNELNVSELEKSYMEIFDKAPFNKAPFDLKTFKEKTFKNTFTIEDLPGFSRVDPVLLGGIGGFNFTFYFLKNAADSKENGKYPYLPISPASRRAWLQKFGGVKIFRDEFRVRPYGEPGQDWLGLGERQAKSPGGPGQKIGGYRIGPNQIAGTVKISRIANAIFQDKSGREGIQENETFELFRNLLAEIIALFERDRNVIMFGLSNLAKQRIKDEADKVEAKALADKILKEAEEEAAATVKAISSQGTSSNPNESKPTQQPANTPNEVFLAKTTKIFEQEIDEKNDEIKLLRGLASVGLIISSFAHELKGLRSRLIPRSSVLLSALHKYLDQDKIKGLKPIESPINMVELIRDEDLKLKHWLDYSLTTLKRDKRNRRKINFGEYFENFEISWKMALAQRKVSLNLIGTKDPKNSIMAFEVDLDSIFNNLLSNSLNAFKDRKGAYQRELTIRWKIIHDHLEILFSDNGIGLAKEYASNPERILEFNESSKRDRTGIQIGTGMGLYIVKLVIDDYSGAEINILPEMQGLTIQIKFLIRKDTGNAI